MAAASAGGGSLATVGGGSLAAAGASLAGCANSSPAGDIEQPPPSGDGGHASPPHIARRLLSPRSGGSSPAPPPQQQRPGSPGGDADGGGAAEPPPPHRRTLSLLMGGPVCALDVESGGSLGAALAAPSATAAGSLTVRPPKAAAAAVAVPAAPRAARWRRPRQAAWDASCLLACVCSFASGAALLACLIASRSMAPAAALASFLAAPPIAAAAMVFFRNRWDDVCLSYFRWVLSARMCVPPPAPARRSAKQRLAVYAGAALETLVLGGFGSLVATYMSLGCIALAMFAVVLVDGICAALVAASALAAGPLRICGRPLNATHAVFLENYKVGRFVAAALLQSAPQAALAAWVMAARGQSAAPAWAPAMALVSGLFALAHLAGLRVEGARAGMTLGGQIRLTAGLRGALHLPAAVMTRAVDKARRLLLLLLPPDAACLPSTLTPPKCTPARSPAPRPPIALSNPSNTHQNTQKQKQVLRDGSELHITNAGSAYQEAAEAAAAAAADSWTDKGGVSGGGDIEAGRPARPAAKAARPISLLPPALCPDDGAQLVPGQMMTLASAAFARYASAGVAVETLALEFCTARQLPKLLADAAAAFPALRELRLERCEVGGGGLGLGLGAALRARARLSALRLSRCALDTHALRLIEELLASTDVPLASLELRRCRLPAAAGARLAHAARGSPTLRSLCLAGSGIGRQSAAALAALINAPGCRIEYLNLSANRVGAEGATALAGALRAPGCPLRALLLTRKDIGSAGAAAIVDALLARAGGASAASGAGLERPPAASAAGRNASVVSDAFSLGPRGRFSLPTLDGLVLPRAASPAPSLPGPGRGTPPLYATVQEEECGGGEEEEEPASPASFAPAAHPGASPSPPPEGGGLALCVVSTAPQVLHVSPLPLFFVAVADALLERLGGGGGGGGSGGGGGGDAASTAAAAAAAALPQVALLSGEGDMADAVGKACRYMPIVELRLGGLGLGSAFGAALATAIAAGLPTERVDLSRNGLDDGAATALARALASNRRLTALDLSGNCVDDAGAAALADALADPACGLRALSLHGNARPLAWAVLQRFARLQASRPELRLDIIRGDQLAATAAGGGGGGAPGSACSVASGGCGAHCASALAAATGSATAWPVAAPRAALVAPIAAARSEDGRAGTPPPPPPQASSSAASSRRASASGAGHHRGHGRSRSSMGSLADLLLRGLRRASLAGSGAGGGGGGAPGAAAAGTAAGGAPTDDDDEDNCFVCFDESAPAQVVTRPCGHRLCAGCFKQMAAKPSKGAPAGSCPFCRGALCGFSYAAMPPMH